MAGRQASSKGCKVPKPASADRRSKASLVRVWQLVHVAGVFSARAGCKQLKLSQRSFAANSLAFVPLALSALASSCKALLSVPARLSARLADLDRILPTRLWGGLLRSPLRALQVRRVTRLPMRCSVHSHELTTSARVHGRT